MRRTNPAKKNDPNNQDPALSVHSYHDNQKVAPPSDSNNNQAKSARPSDGDEADGGGGYKPKLSLPAQKELTYYIGGGNGNALIENVLNDLGWKKLRDKLEDSYTLKWCELKGSINYATFKAGEQLVNHIPNCNLLTNKLGLLNSLQEYDRVCLSMKKKVPKLDFIPETFRLGNTKEREAFRDVWQEGEVWICKPTGQNQGKGIYLVKDLADKDKLLQEAEERTQQASNGQKQGSRVIQRYLGNPLLLNKKKFDIRAYMLVASTVPYLVLYHKGYVRLSMFEYENKFDNLAVHLTNQFIQKKDPKYKEVKEDTIWDFDKFNDYVNANIAADKNLPRDWVHTVLPARMKHIMTYCFNSVKHRLNCKVGYFDLYGFDFMIDDDMKVWLIEVNVNPTLATNCESLKTVIPPIVKETIYLAVECFDKSRRGRPLSPIQSLKNFDIIFQSSASFRSTQTGSPGRKQPASGSEAQSPVRRSRSLSPAKDVGDGGYSRRNLTFLQAGMKPRPTPHTFLYTTRPTNNATSPAANRASTQLKPAAAQATPYISSKIASPSSTIARSYNLEKSRMAQNSRKSPAVPPANERNTTTTGEAKTNKVTPPQGKGEPKVSAPQSTQKTAGRGDVKSGPTVKVTVVEQSLRSKPPTTKPNQTEPKKPVQSRTNGHPLRTTNTSNTTDTSGKKTNTVQKSTVIPREKTPPVLKLILKPNAKSGPGQSPRREVVGVLTKPAQTATSQGPTPSKATNVSKTGADDKKSPTKTSTKSENITNNNNTNKSPQETKKALPKPMPPPKSQVDDGRKKASKSDTRGS